MTLFEAIIYVRLCTLYMHSDRPVRTLILAEMLGKHDRYIRMYLTRMERKEYVMRVGQRGGWLPGRRPEISSSSLAA